MTENVNILNELSQFIFTSKYARYNEKEKRRETWSEAVNRVFAMHNKKFANLSDEDKAKIRWAFDIVEQKRGGPSMRSLQFGGQAVEAHNARIYNCAVRHVDSIRACAEIMYLLLNGNGVGIGLTKQYFNRMPDLVTDNDKTGTVITYVVEDTIEGWSDSIEALLNCYFRGTAYSGRKIVFDYSRIRRKGVRLKVGGGKAPGYRPLKNCHSKIKKLLDHIIEDLHINRIRTIDIYDIIMHCSDAVLSGGVRRSATSVIFDYDDDLMLNAKTGDWFERGEKQRARSNNSVLIVRDKITKEEFTKVIERTKEWGEPGFVFANSDKDMFNPCFVGDTLVAVADGRNAVSIKQLAEENWTGPIYTIKDGKVIIGNCSRVWKTRENAKLVEIILDDNSSFKCTPDHKIMLRNGTFIEAQFLQENDSLMPFNSYQSRAYRQIVSNTARDRRQYRMIAEYHGLLNNLDASLFAVHHKDFNSQNDSIDNLQILTHAEHIELHAEKMRGKNNAVFRIKDVDLWKQRLRARVKGEKNPMSTGLTSLEMYNTIKEKTIQLKRNLSNTEILNLFNIKCFSPGRVADICEIINIDKVTKLTILASEIAKQCNVHIVNGNKQRKKFDTQNHKVKLIKFIDEVQNVYDLTVDETHNFAIITSKEDDKFIKSSGIFVHNCFEIGFNPVTEDGQCGVQFCNLSTINGAKINSEQDFLECVEAVSIIGTLQAAYTDFKYLSPVAKKLTEDEALLGVSITGILDRPDIILQEKLLQKGAKLVVETNKEWAKKIGIKQAARTTCIKPEGTSSLIFEAASGIHPHHAHKYIRRVQANKLDEVYQFFKLYNDHMCEESIYSENKSDDVISFPLQINEHAMVKADLSAIKHLDLIKLVQKNWVIPGTTEANKKNITHNVSCTVIIKPEEWDEVGEYLFKNKNLFAAVSFLPQTGDKDYKQAPLEKVETEKDEKHFQQLLKKYNKVDFTKLIESHDNTNVQEEIICAGGSCAL